MSDTFSQRHRVQELRYVSAEHRLEVEFEDGRSFSLPAEYLRAETLITILRMSVLESDQNMPRH